MVNENHIIYFGWLSRKEIEKLNYNLKSQHISNKLVFKRRNGPGRYQIRIWQINK